jgi:hypothetical protein
VPLKRPQFHGGANGPLHSSRWAEALADWTGERLLTTRQFSSPVAGAVEARTEEFVALGYDEIVKTVRSRLVGGTVAHCSSGRLRCDIGGMWRSIGQRACRRVSRGWLNADRADEVAKSLLKVHLNISSILGDAS